MAATLTSTGVTFSDGTALASAAPANTAVGGMITATPTYSTTANYTANNWYMYLRYMTGDTVAGSGLAYNIYTNSSLNTNWSGGSWWGGINGSPTGWPEVIQRSVSGGRQNIPWRASGTAWPELSAAPIIYWSVPPGSYRCVTPCGYSNLYYASKGYGTNGQWYAGLWQRYA